MLVFTGSDQHGLKNQLKMNAHTAGQDGRILFPGFIRGVKKKFTGTGRFFCLPSAAEEF